MNANATKAHLLDLAKRLDVKGRSRMTKAQLVDRDQQGKSCGDCSSGPQLGLGIQGERRPARGVSTMGLG